MNLFTRIKGQTQAEELLLSAVGAGRLAHAYILAGPQGSGRLSAALDLAKVRICREVDQGYCGECSHCVQIDNFTHPDVRLTIPKLKTTLPEDLAQLYLQRASDGVTPVRIKGNTYISIEQIRELETRLSKKSFEGRGYVEIITGAHLMRREAANAMLKTLEEPPPETLIVLITSSIRGLLPTVRSRAHTVRFGRLSNPMVKRILIDRGIPEEKAEALTLVADGRPGVALEASSDDLRNSSDALELLTLLSSGNTGLMELATIAGTKARQLGREELLMLCSDIISLAHDSRRSLLGADPMSHSDLPALNQRFDDSMLENTVKQMHLCITRLRANVSPAMAFAAALVSSSGR